MQNCDIVSVVENITLSIVEYAKFKNVSIVFDTNVEEQTVACDPDMIERIILNLLSNAIKYTEFGKSVEVAVSADERDAVIEVRDEGVGIPGDKLGVIFDRFVQADSPLSRQREGTGIGLYLVKLYSEALGGTTTVQSRLGEGSVFTLRLPNRMAEVQAPPDQRFESAENRLEQAAALEFAGT
jgi:signal transduction histidine kinase